MKLALRRPTINDSLRLNGSFFYYDYSDLQVSTFLNGTTVVENAAEATIIGLELDLLAPDSRPN